VQPPILFILLLLQFSGSKRDEGRSLDERWHPRKGGAPFSAQVLIMGPVYGRGSRVVSVLRHSGV
jgi:hypothetical protein